MLWASLQRPELFFTQSGLLKDFAKRTGGQGSGMHGNISLPPIRVTENLVTS